jgi:predicted CoA-substrate-specific enzyme activase
VDFVMNALCAAGTGSFLDQQAERLGISIDGEFAELALGAVRPARIAGRCTVFAKSDMIHLQQAGTPLPEILAGLCLALARNYKAVIGKGRSFPAPVLFQGGVAFNGAVVRAFEQVLELGAGDLIVPEHHWRMAALGAAFLAMDVHGTPKAIPFRGLAPLERAVRAGNGAERMPPLVAPACPGRPVQLAGLNGGPPVPAYLGIDVGSISTCLVVVGEDGAVLARRYLLTRGEPLESVRRGLLELGSELEGRVVVRGVGTTGSGRYLTGDFVGADVVRNEITAQARAAVAADPSVDTVFEIGGQDSKYIRLHNGAVVEFTMNHACAAGTGSFLEEQAERLKIDIGDDFSRLAFASTGPVCLGERCTVFMESDLVHHQQQGEGVEDLAGGLAYSIVQNYLNRVVDGRPVGRRVFFQGGVAWNQSVVAAFEKQLGRPITVPPHHDLTGAIGAALLAREAAAAAAGAKGAPAPTRFRGFDLSRRKYESTTFECRACPNVCQVNRVVMGGEPPIFYGAHCDRFEEAGRVRRGAVELPDHFAEREALLLGGWTPPAPEDARRRVAVPRSLLFHDLFPYWWTFFTELGFAVELSEPTSPRTLRAAQESAAAETCLPAKLVFGHVTSALEKRAEFLFLPAVVNRENCAPGQRSNQYCPYIPASAYLADAHLEPGRTGVRVLKVALEMSWARGDRSQIAALAPQLGLPRRRLVRAAKAAEAAQSAFYAAVRRRGAEVLGALPADVHAAVLVGRPYNTHDRGGNLDLPFKLRKLGVLPIPMDFLPLERVDLSDRFPNMYWRGGQDILAAGTLIAADPRLQAVYLTNFGCGPDSFLTGFFRRVLGSKPCLELEIDDHTADAGVITRCEAFFDSLPAAPARRAA